LHLSFVFWFYFLHFYLSFMSLDAHYCLSFFISTSCLVLASHLLLL
jgi:hypothetical protein